MRLILCLTILCLHFSIVKAQNGRAVLEKYFTQLQYDSVWAGTIITSTFSGTSKTPDHTINIQVKRLGNCFIYISEYFEVVQNNDYIVSVDKVSKAVTVGVANSTTDKKFTFFDQKNLQKELDLVTKESRVFEKGGSTCIKLEEPTEYFAASEYCFDSNNSDLVSTTNWYLTEGDEEEDNSSYVVSTFIRKIELQRQLKYEDFSVFSIIRIRDGKASLTPAYKGYRFYHI